MSAASLSIGVLCASGCLNGFSDHNVRADLDSAVVTISAPTPPSAPTAAGLLTQPIWHGGAATLAVSSTDPVGISQIQLRRADGTALATATLACDYTYPVPCPEATAVPLSVDTTQLPDGVNALTVVATDAAQNVASSPIAVMVANHAPPPPRLTGAPAGRTRQATASVTAQLVRGSVPITAVDWMLCGSAGCGPATAVPVSPGAPSPSFKVTVPQDGDYTVAAYAIDAAGRRSPTATEPFDVDRTLPATHASRPQPRTGGSTSPGLPVLPARAGRSVRLPDLVGPAGARLRLTLRRRPHHRVEVDLRANSTRPVRVRLGLAFAGHPARISRLTLHRGRGSLATPVPAGATALTLTLAGLGARATDPVRLAPSGAPS